MSRQLILAVVVCGALAYGCRGGVDRSVAGREAVPGPLVVAPIPLPAAYRIAFNPGLSDLAPATSAPGSLALAALLWDPA